MDPVSCLRLVLSCLLFLPSPLSCLCDWLTCLFEEIQNVCSHNKKTHTDVRANARRMYTDASARTHKDNEPGCERRRRIKTDCLISRGHLPLTLPWLSSLLSGALKWTVIRLWYSGKWTVIRVCYCGSSARAAHWIFTPLLNVKISSPLLCTNSVAWQRPFADGVRGMVEAVCVCVCACVCVDRSPKPGGPSEGIFWLLDPCQIMGQL